VQIFGKRYKKVTQLSLNTIVLYDVQNTIITDYYEWPQSLQLAESFIKPISLKSGDTQFQIKKTQWCTLATLSISENDYRIYLTSPEKTEFWHRSDAANRFLTERTVLFKSLLYILPVLFNNDYCQDSPLVSSTF